MPKTRSKNLPKLLSILNDGKWHDGDALGAALGVSRAAVWKMIKKLVLQGVEIVPNKGKGYQLQQPVVLLEQEKILKKLQHGCELSVFESITSTNDYCRDHGDTNNILCCLAERQTHGRGRFGRKWYSPFARNIYLSISYPMDKDISELAGLSLVMALAVIDALKPYLNDKMLEAKWPNDILCEGEKLAGILVEVKAESHGGCQVIIGLGVNVNPGESDVQIDQPWTSIYALTNKRTDRNELAASLINRMLDYLQLFAAKGLANFIREWHQVDYLQGKTIQLKGLRQKIQGIVAGVSEQGHLLLKDKSGKISSYSAGDVSILKY